MRGLRFRHPELVSGPMPLRQCKFVFIENFFAIEAWMLKQVQHDEVLS